jgi:hypothetical protein
MLHYTLYVLGGLFVLGFLINQSKTRKLVKTLGVSHAKEVGIETTATLFLRNPFYSILVVFIGFFEFIRIAVGLVTEVFMSVLDLIAATNRILFQDHKSAATAYSFVLALHKTLAKEDLEKIAEAYDVPQIHLEKIWKEPLAKNVTACIYERNAYKHLSGAKYNEYLLNIKAIEDLVAKHKQQKSSADEENV